MKPHTIEVHPGPPSRAASATHPAHAASAAPAVALSGTLRAVPSKSVTHRAFLLAAQCSQPSTVQNALLADDTRAMLAALLALGARVHLDPDHPSDVQFLPAGLRPPATAIDCSNAGTALRLLAGTVARFAVPVLLTGDASLRQRPNGPLLTALQHLGVRTASATAGQAPLTIQGPMRPGIVDIDATQGSQFVSALLLSLPFLSGPSAIRLQGPPASAPYLALTRDVAAQYGVPIEAPTPGTFTTVGNAQPDNPRFVVEGDWSAAAFPFAAAAITGGSVSMVGLRPDSRQGDRAILDHLVAFGASTRIEQSAQAASCTGAPLSAPGTIDVTATPDLFPVLAAVAAHARGTTTFTGIATLRHKESDRVTAMADGLRALGIAVQVRDGAVDITGGRPRGANLSSRGDHRIHMALTVAALAADGPSRIDGADTAAVSYPGFHDDLASLGARLTGLQGIRTVLP